ncbi:MAG: hypothetical protein FRX48_06293 [Lasallia pustulata]|uniref:Uncharacterized protein n=1 Tax=Lasallia pustulata TaxID=136370 RepID=A0A5M8PJR9_9LECA|nr:MAG: hypothetical protein FRX48_06293 [Lasallia pustulata]
MQRQWLQRKNVIYKRAIPSASTGNCPGNKNPGELLTPKEPLNSDRSPERRRKRSREAEDPTPTVPAEPPQKRP